MLCPQSGRILPLWLHVFPFQDEVSVPLVITHRSRLRSGSLEGLFLPEGDPPTQKLTL